ncbi:MAG: HEAT repeat domain-containing protein [Myxococcota bacterium]
MRTATGFGRPRWWVALGVAFLVVTPLHAAPPFDPPGRGNAPGHPTDAEADDAEHVVSHCAQYPGPAVRRACVTLSRVRRCKSVQSLAQVVEDQSHDAGTRAMAALSIGAIACHGNGRPGLVPPVVRVLEAAMDRQEPLLLRQAAARALGRSRAERARGTLEAAWADAHEDPVLRLIAGQALTSITGEVFTTATFLDQIQADMAARSSFRLLAVEP